MRLIWLPVARERAHGWAQLSGGGLRTVTEAAAGLVGRLALAPGCRIYLLGTEAQTPELGGFSDVGTKALMCAFTISPIRSRPGPASIPARAFSFSAAAPLSKSARPNSRTGRFRCHDRPIRAIYLISWWRRVACTTRRPGAEPHFAPTSMNLLVFATVSDAPRTGMRVARFRQGRFTTNTLRRFRHDFSR